MTKASGWLVFLVGLFCATVAIANSENQPGMLVLGFTGMLFGAVILLHEHGKD